MTPRATYVSVFSGRISPFCRGGWQRARGIRLDLSTQFRALGSHPQPCGHPPPALRAQPRAETRP